MSSKNIIEKINADYIAEANEMRSSLLGEASSRAEQIIEAAKESADEVLAEARKRGEEEMRRAALVASLDSRKATLEAKRTVVEKVFEKAADAIDNFDDERWSSFMIRLILSSGADGDEHIYVPNDIGREKEFKDYFRKIGKDPERYEYQDPAVTGMPSKEE